MEVRATESPVAPPITLNTAKNFRVSIAVADIIANAHDPEGLSLTVSALRHSVNGRAYYERGTNREVISFSPRRNFTGQASFKYVLKNESGDSVLGDIIVEVDPTEAPVTPPIILTTDKNIAVSIKTADILANANDPQGQTLTFSGLRNSVNGRAYYERGTNREVISFTPRRNFIGEASLKYALKNQSGDDVLGEIIVVVDPTEAPLAAAEEFVTPLNTALTVPIAGLLANDSDPNGQEITFDGTRNAKNCRVSYERGDRSKLVITPRRNFSGQAFFTYRIENQSGDIGTATVNIEVIQ